MAELAAILRGIIFHLKLRRTNTAYRPPIPVIKGVRRVPTTRSGIPLIKFARHENNDAAEDMAQSSTPTIHESTRVCIVETKECSELKIPGMNIDPHYSVGDVYRSYATMTEDEILLETFTWSQGAQGTLLKEYTMPFDGIMKLKSNPVCVPFLVHNYWKGDLQFRIVVNANKFQAGQIQASWWYDALSDSKFSLRENVFTASQTPHVLINAGTSNEACLTVGYRSPYMCIPITSTERTQDALNLGKLVLRVLNPLSSPDSSAKQCSVSIFIKFLNAQFFGARNGDVGDTVSPEMMEGALTLAGLSMAERVLNNVLPDHNRDNPPVTGPGSPMVPQAMQSLCTGTGDMEPINHLRLDAKGQVPHLESPNTLSQWTDIAKTYGLVKTYKWTKDHKEGAVIFTVDGAPQFPLIEYNTHTIESDSCFSIPPVAVASSLFSYWRGCLKMKLDIVGTSMHTGKLLVCYCPRVLSDITINQARGSPHVVIDMKDGPQSYTITLPFISNKYYWHSRYSSNDPGNFTSPPGRVHVFVLNKLIPMESINNFVYINMYWAAGDNFELAIPCQPTFGTSFFTTKDKPSAEVKAYGGYWPFYWGYYNSFYGGVKAIARYGKGWQHVAQFQNLKMNYYYTVNANSVASMPPFLIKNDGQQFIPKYFCPIDLNDGAGLRYLGVMETEENAKKYAALPPDKKDFSLFMDIKNNDDGPWSSPNVNPLFDGHAETMRVPPKIVAFHENDPNTSNATEEGAVVLDCTPCPKPKIAVNVFGENFNDVKTLCRRYQPYCMFQGVTSQHSGSASIALPLVPQGLDLDIDEHEATKLFYNRYVRDGTIPIVASAYRYVRGSMRLRIVLPSDVRCNVWTQHRADIHMDKWAVKPIAESGVAACYLNTGYAVCFQTTKVNNTLSIEIPYYQPYAFVLNQRTDLKRGGALQISSLGTLYIGFEQNTSTPQKFPVSVFYALGDDCFFEYFQGFPPMIPLARRALLGEVVDAAKHEGFGDTAKALLNAPKLVDRVLDQMTDTLDKVVTEKGVGININGLPSEIKHSHDININIGSETREFINNAGESTSGFVKDIMGTKDPNEAVGVVQQFISWLDTITNGTINFGVDLVSQIMHCAVSPVKGTIAIAIVTILVKLGLIGSKFFDKVINSAKNLIDYLGISGDDKPKPDNIPPERDETGKVHARVEADYDMVTSFIDVAFAAVSTVLQVSVTPPKNVFDFTKIVTKEITQNVRNANQVTLFMRNNILVFKKIAEYVTTWTNKATFMEKIMEDDMVPLLSWVEECELLLDPRHEEKSYAMDSMWADRIETAYVLGCTINKHFSAYLKSGRNQQRELYDMFKRLFGRLTNRREAIFKRGKGTVSRREPFAIWLYGRPGVGKSQLAQYLIPNLLSSAGIGYTGEPIYTLPSGAKFWTGCRAQPAILLDDFLNVQTGEIKDESIRHVFAVKSPAALNPPMAHLDDKELRYNPEIMVICSNYDFPEIANVDMTAVWRRREVLLKCTLDPRLIAAGYTSFSERSESVKAFCRENEINYRNYEHLNMQFSDSPSAPGCNYSDPLNINAVLSRLQKEFIDYKTDQHELFIDRMALYNARVKNSDDDTLSISEKLAEFKRLCGMLNDLKWHDHVSFKDRLRLSTTYSQTGTISQEMLACLQENVDIVKKKMEKPQENTTVPLPSDFVKHAQHENTDAAGPTTTVDNSATTTTVTTTNTTVSSNLTISPTGELKVNAVTNTDFSKVPESFPREQLLNREGKALQVDYVSLYEPDCKDVRIYTEMEVDSLFFDLAGCHVHDSVTLNKMRNVVCGWYGVKGIKDAYCLSILYAFTTMHLPKPYVIDSATLSTGCSMLYVRHNNLQNCELWCACCNSSVLGATFHPACPSLQQLYVLLHKDNLIMKKKITFNTYGEYTQLINDLRGREFRDIIVSLYKTPKIWSRMSSMLTNLLFRVIKVYYKANSVEELEIHIKNNVTNVKAALPAYEPDKILETIKTKYPKCIHSKLKVDFVCDIDTLNGDKPYFSPMDLGSELRIPDDKCGEECVLVKEPELGRALYCLWTKHNPNSENKPLYFVNNAVKESLSKNSDKNEHSSFFSKVRKAFVAFWEYVKKLGDWLWRHIKPVLKPLWTFMKYLIPFFLLVGLLWGVYALATGSSIVGGYYAAATTVGGAVCGATATVGSKFSQLFSRQSSNTPKFTPSHENATSYSETLASGARNPAPRSVAFARHQGGDCSQKMQEVMRLVSNNTYFACVNEDLTGSLDRMVAIYQNYFLILKHYYECWISKNTNKLYIFNPSTNSKVCVPIDSIVLESVPDKSIAIIHIPTMPYNRKITHLFATALEHTVPRGNCFLQEVMVSHTMVHEKPITFSAEVVIDGYNCDRQVLDGVYEYAWHGNGRCGTLLMAPNLNRPIIGVHCAGMGGRGYADPITREMLANYDGKLYEKGYNEDNRPHKAFKTNYVSVGRTDHTMEHHESGNTRIIPSIIYGVFPVVSGPAPLQKGDKRVEVPEGTVYSPLWSGVANMGIVTMDFPKLTLDTAMDYLKQRLITLAPPLRENVRPLTMNHAICGIPGMDYYESLNFSTSEGFPWSRFRPAGERCKEWLFDFDTDEDGNRVLYSVHPELWDQMTAEEDDRVNGIPVDVVFDDCLKDARLPLEKIKKPGKTRIFSISPIQYTIPFKRYFGDFIAAFTAARLKLNHAIGIACDGPEWGMLIRKLVTHGTNYVTGDYKNFGPGLNTACLLKVCECILAWYEHYDQSHDRERSNKIRRALLSELVCARHCAYDFVYNVFAGIPSGCPATAPLNSLVNEMYMLSAWIHIMEDTEYCSLNYFFSHTKLITYGDDFILSVHNDVVDRFNGVSIQNFFQQYNIVLTSANKTSEVMTAYTKNIYECTFLKRGFARHPTRAHEFLAPLDLDFSVKDVANWIHKSPDTVLATKINAEACVRNSYGHGPAVYNEIKRTIATKCANVGLDILLRTWEEYDALFFSKQ
ncbi:MAG: polyprotein [Hangzhou iflavirus 4]|nr:MAG: polyprotein [Hangzhou iflavirus 4]